ncbi:MAG TPA: ABC transporter substrate-binding protein [Clostridia bacterium]|nr:ABC transporter substrate-binding protein [Clostridia bacterium]
MSKVTVKNTVLKTAMILVIIAGILSVSGCSRETASTQGSGKEMSLSIGIMPAVDSAPILLAEKKGYFEKLGLDMDIQVYTNAMNRQSALQSGGLDGAMTDVVALVNNVGNGFDIKVTTCTDGVFPFLIRKGFEEKKDIKAGMMEVSVTNYLTDRFLSSMYNVEKIYIDEIPARLEMVAKGTLDMAVVPEPMASQGELNGLTKKLIGNTDKFSPDVMVFTGKALKSKEKAIRLFHKAYDQAVDEIDKNDGEARDVLFESLKLKPETRDRIIVPAYNRARIPDREYLQGILDWNEKVLGIKLDVKYEDLVEGKFTE